MKKLLYGSPIYGLMLNGKTPDHLRLSPPERLAGDAVRGRGIVDGDFVLARHRVHLETPEKEDCFFPAPPDDEDQAAALHGFSWLADLVALGNAEALLRARTLIRGWIETYGDWQELPWRADVLGERLAAWLVYAWFVCPDDGDMRRAVLDSAMRQTRHLGRSCATAPKDARVFKAINGLMTAAVCLPGAEIYLDSAIDVLNREMARQILADGGHIERNPSLQLEVLNGLNDTRDLLIAAHLEVPATLLGAIDRMTPMLRALRLGDGGLALFNGSFEEGKDRVKAVLTGTGIKGQAVTSAPHSGFQRLSAGRTTVIMDTGKPIPGGQANAHAGTLSFEMSVGKDRLVVNCGSRHGGGWHTASRTSAAHSTLVADDTNSMEFLSGGRIGVGPTNVTCTRRESDGKVWLQTSHNGYARTVGVLHKRSLFLSDDGEDLRGEDIVEGSGGKDFCVRFHLHPGVHASQVQGRSAVLLKLPGGGGWQFQATGGVISLEESIYLGEDAEPRRIEQIVVSGPLHGDGAEIKWRFHRI
ncbi:MAG: heparinase II/III family protein [Alphaproteobacteria bacterium]